MARKPKSLGQICRFEFEAGFQDDMMTPEKAFKRAAAAVEREVLKRLNLKKRIASAVALGELRQAAKGKP